MPTPAETQPTPPTRQMIPSSLPYRILRSLFIAITRIQVAELQSSGNESIAPDGPLILAGNHPNSFLDFFALLTVVRGPIAPIAKDTIRSVFLIGPIAHRLFHLVLVSRKMDGSGNEAMRREANQRMRDEATWRLENGEPLLIYPEGASSGSGLGVSKIRPGFMQLLLLAEEKHNFQLGARIQPFLYHYRSIDTFRSRILVRFLPALSLDELIGNGLCTKLRSAGSDNSTLLRKALVEGKRRYETLLRREVPSAASSEEESLLRFGAELFAWRRHGRFSIKEHYTAALNLSRLFATATPEEGAHSSSENLKGQLATLRQLLAENGIALERLAAALAFTPNANSIDCSIESGPRQISLPLGALTLALLSAPILLLHLPFYALGSAIRLHYRRKPGSNVDGDEHVVALGFALSLLWYPTLAGAAAIASYNLTEPLLPFAAALTLALTTAIATLLLLPLLWRIALDANSELWLYRTAESGRRLILNRTPVVVSTLAAAQQLESQYDTLCNAR